MAKPDVRAFSLNMVLKLWSISLGRIALDAYNFGDSVDDVVQVCTIKVSGRSHVKNDALDAYRLGAQDNGSRWDDMLKRWSLDWYATGNSVAKMFMVVYEIGLGKTARDLLEGVQVGVGDMCCMIVFF